MTQTTAFLLTLLIEVPVAVVLLAWAGKARGRWGTVVLVATAASLVTHPLLCLAPVSTRNPETLWLAEGLITLVEAGIYKVSLGLPARLALLVSLVANAASLGIGLLLHSVRLGA
ncbi:MAG: hypothetical protein R3F05_00195 [Planctomycetota bacterium]